MSEVAEFKVAHLYKPYEGKGKAKIVAHDGTKYSCEESQLAQFSEEEDVAIYWEQKSFKAKTGENVSYKQFVKKIQKTNGASAQKQFTRAAANPTDSERMATFGMTNALLTGWAQGRSLDEILETPNDKFRLLADKMNAVVHSTKVHGAQAQTRDDLNDTVTF